MKRYQWAIAISTFYLIVNTILVKTTTSLPLLATLFAGAPFIIIWVAIAILKAPFHVRDLTAGDEYGYGDRSKESMGFLW